jgi:hypothetical protein
MIVVVVAIILEGYLLLTLALQVAFLETILSRASFLLELLRTLLGQAALPLLVQFATVLGGALLLLRHHLLLALL